MVVCSLFDDISMNEYEASNSIVLHNYFISISKFSSPSIMIPSDFCEGVYLLFLFHCQVSTTCGLGVIH